jgi:threonine dehydratase
MNIPADVAASRARMNGRIRRTPLVRSDWLSDAVRGDVYLKLESLQVTSSFKARGALNAVFSLVERLLPGGPSPQIVTASAGNHGRAIAWACEIAGLRHIVFTPRNAPDAKLSAIRRHGADLRAIAADYEDAERTAKRFAAETGGHFISAYSHPDLLAGIGTIAVEILEELPDTTRAVVPVGGGGLIAGLATTFAAAGPTVEVIGVEVEASHPFTASLAAGRIVEVQVGPTLADGLAGNMDPDNIAFPIVQRLVERIVLTGEDDLTAAMRGLLQHEHLVAEGAGAAAVAALLAGRVDARQGRTVVIVSGANVDLTVLARVLAADS